MIDYSNIIMDYNEGVAFMKDISLKGNPESSFRFGIIRITYPGKKENGDYRLSLINGGHIPTHVDIINAIINKCTPSNRESFVKDFEEIYLKGLKAETVSIPENFKILIYWITLQEDINYPRPMYKGIKLPFQRFFEATLICLEILSIEELHHRTNNHGRPAPTLNSLSGLTVPVFYN